MTAAELIKTDHPLHAAFLRFLKGKEPTKRQARKFLQQFPQFREAKDA